MPRTQITQLVNRNAQTSDTAVYLKELPERGYISAIDVGVRLQNGSTSAVNKDILDVVKKLELIFNGNEARWTMSGVAAFRHQWMKNGAPLAYTFSQTGSATQEVWFRIQLGRFVGDKSFGLDLSRFNTVQLSLDYDATVWGAAAVTTFTTGTFAPSIILHQFPLNQPPGFRGMIGTRRFYNTTTVASGDLDTNLPSSLPIAGLGMYVGEDNVAEGTDITDVIIGKDNLSTRWVDLKWYNAQMYCNQWINERSEEYELYVTAADTLDCHLANIRRVSTTGLTTSFVGSSTDGVNNFVDASAWTGNRITYSGQTLTYANGTATTQTTSALSAKKAWTLIEGDIHGYLYFPFADFSTMENVLTPSELQTAQVRGVQGAAGAVYELYAEEIYA